MTRKLLFLSGLAIFAVVCNHAAQWGTVSMFWWTDRYLAVPLTVDEQINTLSYLVLAAVRKLALFSVPSFLVIAGIFVAYAVRGEQSTLTWKAMKTRILNLLVPYLIWSIVIFVGEALQGQVYTPMEYLRRLCLGQAIGAYFYIPVLCQLYLLSPLIVPYAKTHAGRLLAASALVHFVLVILAYLPVAGYFLGGDSPALYVLRNIPSALFVRLQFFFVFGVVVGLRSKQVSEWVTRHKSLLLVLVGASALLAVVEAEVFFRLTGLTYHEEILTIPTTLYAVTTILLFLGSSKESLPGSKVLHQLGIRSFGIYLLNGTLLAFVARAVQKFIPWFLAYELLFVVCLIAIGIGIPFLLTQALAKSPARRYYRYLFG
jgi:peptidoglycan/LPS O-acetylase OafA/YrhL